MSLNEYGNSRLSFRFGPCFWEKSTILIEFFTFNPINNCIFVWAEQASGDFMIQL